MNIPTEKTERQKLAQSLLKNAGLLCDEVPELLENWILRCKICYCWKKLIICVD